MPSFSTRSLRSLGEFASFVATAGAQRIVVDTQAPSSSPLRSRTPSRTASFLWQRAPRWPVPTTRRFALVEKTTDSPTEPTLSAIVH